MAKQPGIFITYETVRDVRNSIQGAGDSDSFKSHIGALIDQGYAVAVGETSIEQKGEEILDYLLEVASGRKSRSEQLGYGGAEFIPWHIGAVM